VLLKFSGVVFNYGHVFVKMELDMIESYDDLLNNIEQLEQARKSDGQVKALYNSLIGLGSVFLPYLNDDGIAFAPSRFIGYRNNTVLGHSQLEDRDGRRTNVRVSEVLTEQYGFRIVNKVDDDAAYNYQVFCNKLSIDPRNSRKSFWLTPPVEEWLEADAGNRIAALEQEISNDSLLPETTRAAIVKARVGQGLFRRLVLQLYGCCLVTNIEEPKLLVASHIKPWKDCRKNPQECLDPHNALLLSPTWDRLFDQGFVSFSENGEMLISDNLTNDVQEALNANVTSIKLTERQSSYMAFHRRLHGSE
jgi:putative restriction endonuclease